MQGRQVWRLLRVSRGRAGDSPSLCPPTDWLLLQTPAEQLTEGEPLFLQCHSWRNWRVNKVTFYKDNVSLKFWYENHNISVDRVTVQDSGKYHCVGEVLRLKQTSEPVSIVVHKGEWGEPTGTASRVRARPPGTDPNHCRDPLLTSWARRLDRGGVGIQAGHESWTEGIWVSRLDPRAGQSGLGVKAGLRAVDSMLGLGVHSLLPWALQLVGQCPHGSAACLS